MNGKTEIKVDAKDNKETVQETIDSRLNGYKPNKNFLNLDNLRKRLKKEDSNV